MNGNHLCGLGIIDSALLLFDLWFSAFYLFSLLFQIISLLHLKLMPFLQGNKDFF